MINVAISKFFGVRIVAIDSVCRHLITLSFQGRDVFQNLMLEAPEWREYKSGRIVQETLSPAQVCRRDRHSLSFLEGMSLHQQEILLVLRLDCLLIRSCRSNLSNPLILKEEI